MNKRFTIVLLFCFSLFYVVNCNIFDWMTAADDEAFYEGLKYFNEKKFTDARMKFAEAMEQDPNRSDYRYYHAKAAIMEMNLDFYTIARRIIKIDTSAVSNLKLPLYTKEADLTLIEDIMFKNNIYRATIISHDDLSPIFYGKTHGTIHSAYIAFEFSIMSMARAILQLRDTNNDKVINESDQYIEIKKFRNPQNGNEFYLPDLPSIANYLNESESNQAGFNAMLTETAKYATEGVVALVNSFSDTVLFNNADLENLIEKIDVTANYYRVNDGIDNDNDGATDEEAINFRDDDGDGNTDEDAHL